MKDQQAVIGTPGTSPTGSDALDELQRGQETAPTVETLERTPVGQYGQPGRRQAPIPDPGERPGAVRIDEEAERENVGT